MKKVIRVVFLGMVLFGALQAGFADGGPQPMCVPGSPCAPSQK